MKVHVLLKQSDDGHVSVLGVYETIEGRDARIERIRKANKQYPMEQIGRGLWRVGPTEDEGFFGHKPVTVRSEETELHG